MMKRETIAIADVYVPIKRRATLEQKRVDEIAASILDKGLQTPILVGADGARFVLVVGLHRLEHAKALRRKDHRQLPCRCAEALKGGRLHSLSRTRAELLAPVNGWFTEGFDPLDLKEAKALLDELRA